MIIGAHAIVYSKDADADRAFLDSVLGSARVDAGDGWLIFRLPPAELAVHPAEENDVHELYLMTDDVEELVASLARRGIGCTPISDQGWGFLTRVTLPGGGKLGIYQPRHASPAAHRARGRTLSKPSKRASLGKRSRAKAPSK
jgi:hypothetical protein